MKTLLVTGIAGFIGSNLAKELLVCFPDYAVVGIDDLSSGRKQLVPKGAKLIEGKIQDQKFVEKVFKKYKPEYVFHLAAVPRVLYSVEHPIETTDANIAGTVTLLEAAARHKVQRFIFSSSSSVYGTSATLPTKEKENPPKPVSPYALQKYTGEHYMRIFSELYNLDTVSLRYFNVFGPGQYGDSPYSTVISAWLFGIYDTSGRKPYMTGDGMQSKDYNYIQHVVEANIQAMQSKKPLKGIALNVASGKQHTLWDIKKLLEQITGKDLDLERRPPRPGDVLFSRGDTTLAKKTLGYKPVVSFKQALQETAAWVATISEPQKQKGRRG
jgi:nucleoside-diphosphate-sugar epimerase